MVRVTKFPMISVWTEQSTGTGTAPGAKNNGGMPMANKEQKKRVARTNKPKLSAKEKKDKKAKKLAAKQKG